REAKGGRKSFQRKNSLHEGSMVVGKDMNAEHITEAQSIMMVTCLKEMREITSDEKDRLQKISSASPNTFMEIEQENINDTSCHLYWRDIDIILHHCFERPKTDLKTIDALIPLGNAGIFPISCFFSYEDEPNHTKVTIFQNCSQTRIYFNFMYSVGLVNVNNLCCGDEFSSCSLSGARSHELYGDLIIIVQIIDMT
ncbi:hypothetical protein ACJX0J_020770, partial [Zea mays]